MTLKRIILFPPIDRILFKMICKELSLMPLSLERWQELSGKLITEFQKPINQNLDFLANQAQDLNLGY